MSHDPGNVYDRSLWKKIAYTKKTFENLLMQTEKFAKF